ncbi:uncharacterized protein LOC130935635 [Arachis stenosperma]|uniref:uncharacterized protein LOC130935635 n=1 Tax=Arachis stenosperma TaxID=217475 RepID=UPI0025ABE884|nr:uncharacterized protein LOC130935635 [Arachis stenosperma]
MSAMTNLANTMQANTAVTMQAMERMGQPAGNGNENENGNGEGDDNDLGDAPMALALFLKVHPLTFRGLTNSTKVDNWFQAMECALKAQHVPTNQYVEFAAYQLLGEAQYWWHGECQLLQLLIAEIPLDVFQTVFYKKYFPKSVRESKELELMQLKQGLLSVVDYTSRFEELCRFSRARNVEECAKKVASSKDTPVGNNNRGRGKYFPQRAQNFKRRGHVPQGQGGFKRNKYDQYQHPKGRGNQSKASSDLTCDRYERFHLNDSCKLGISCCFNCGLPGHMARDCTRGRNPNAGRNQYQGRVFAVNANDAAKADPLMRP